MTEQLLGSRGNFLEVLCGLVGIRLLGFSSRKSFGLSEEKCAYIQERRTRHATVWTAVQILFSQLVLGFLALFCLSPERREEARNWATHWRSFSRFPAIGAATLSVRLGFIIILL